MCLSFLVSGATEEEGKEEEEGREVSSMTS
jgi:hypothetical protein